MVLMAKNHAAFPGVGRAPKLQSALPTNDAAVAITNAGNAASRTFPPKPSTTTAMIAT